MASSFTQHVPSGKPVTTRIIDSTSKIAGLPMKALMKPGIEGLEMMPEAPTWSFLIEHESGRKLLFDLGIPTDWQDAAPAVSDRLKSMGWDISVQKPTVDILKEQGIDASAIEAIVWSHWHWDHIGNPDTFPSSTKLIVGPGFKDEKLPAYPENPKADVRESDFEGRELLEISFTEKSALQIGPFRALDYFQDGSFYLLDTPGHAVGHLAGLARTTTNPDTFIFMGGDLTHHAGELRPSEHVPLPSSVPLSGLPNLISQLQYSTACPGAIFEAIQNSNGRTPESTTPFFEPAMGKDIPLAIETIKKTQTADADENILYIFAHDSKVRGTVDLFPEKANAWKEKGWGEKMRWAFLDDFAVAAKSVKDQQEHEGTKL